MNGYKSLGESFCGAVKKYNKRLFLSLRRPQPFSSMLAYETLIQKCATTTSLRRSRQLHALLLTATTIVTPTPYLNNNLLSMYSRCGSLIDSQQVFDKMPQRNGVSFNGLISAYSKEPNQAFYAFNVLSQMTTQGVKPNSLTFSSILQAASCLEDWPRGSSLHAQVVQFGYTDDIRVQTSLLGMYSKCGDFDSASRVFNYMICRDVVAWNSIILASMKNDRIRQGFGLFAGMLRAGLEPTNFTYSMLLNASSRLGDHISGRIIHAHVIKYDSAADVPLQNALLDMYFSCGDTETAVCAFGMVNEPDLVSWNSILSGYSANGDGMAAMYLFVQLCRTSYTKPDEYTFAAVISATGALPASDYGKPLHARVRKTGFESGMFVGSTLINMYFKNDDASSAQSLFHSMPERDVVLWTEMISGHSRLGDGESALKYFYQMQEEGHKADSYALSSALSACADLAALRQGEMIHSEALKTGFELDMCVCGSLVDMYCKSGNLSSAQLLFSRVGEPDLKCWNSMLGGYCNHGQAVKAIKLYDEILKQGLRPDQVTFVSLLSACSHGGMVEEGRFFWNHMEINGLVPRPKHYSCMVSLLCRAGLLNEAKELIEEAPFSETFPEWWRILLSSCVVYKELELGVHAAEQVLSWEGEDPATFILLSNLYAAAGKWDAVAEMRRKIRGMVLEKDPGLSWVELMDKIHVFASNDQSHLQVEDAKAELHRLQENMRRWETDEIVCEW